MEQNNLTKKVVEEVNPLKEAIDKCRFAFKIVFCFAFVINLLMLITPLYSLQVLDRVIGSGNLNTLLMLSIIIASIYFIYALLQIARSFTLIKIGEWLDNNVSPLVFSRSISASAMRFRVSSSQMLRDFQNIKMFLTSTGINTLLDAPWSILYIVVIFFIHPYIGYVTIAGAVIIVSFGMFNAVATNKVLGDATEFSIKGLNQAEVANRNSESVEAMGMIKNVSKTWSSFNKGALSKQSVASYRNGILSNLSRFIRNILQMSVTGIGAYVVVSSNGRDMTTGNMIASSIIVGRALAPFDNAIVIWKSISGAIKSYKNVNLFFSQKISKEEYMSIPDVQGTVSVENISFSFQHNMLLTQQNVMPKFILKDVSFYLDAGDSLAIIGHSAAGKSTLSKIISGVWAPSSGVVRLDGGNTYTWNRENIGAHIGYLPQGVELFSGTVKANIARMQQDPSPEEIIRVSKMCGAHEMILSLPEGYDTEIGINGSNLSGGQRQRLGLARAFYGKPKLVILDEPNANLDEGGEKALSNALLNAKALNITVIIISHRHTVLSVVDKILILEQGRVVKFGNRSDIIAATVLSNKKDTALNN